MAESVEQPIVLQYLGFETKGALREYAFSLRGHGGESSSYFVTIPNEAFSAHRARYQDAPAIGSIRLHREFATQAGHPAASTFSVIDVELDIYKHGHTTKTMPSHSKARTDEKLNRPWQSL